MGGTHLQGESWAPNECWRLGVWTDYTLSALCANDKDIYAHWALQGLTRPQKLTHERMIVQDNIWRQFCLPPTNVGLNTTFKMCRSMSLEKHFFKTIVLSINFTVRCRLKFKLCNDWWRCGTHKRVEEGQTSIIEVLKKMNVSHCWIIILVGDLIHLMRQFHAYVRMNIEKFSLFSAIFIIDFEEYQVQVSGHVHRLLKLQVLLQCDFLLQASTWRVKPYRNSFHNSWYISTRFNIR